MSEHTCDICNSKEWHSLDYLRNKEYWFDANIIFDEEIGFKVCKECGFLTYTPRWSEEELKKRYSKSRPIVTSQMIAQATKKIYFHINFLTNDFILRAQQEKENFSILDIGCSFGSIRGLFPDAKIYGIEYSESLARYAQRAQKISVIDKVEQLEEKSVDLVILYHTLEHVTRPAEVLRQVKRVLKDDGTLYIAVPDYLCDLREVSGKACLEFEELYHLNHHNVFSKRSFDNLLKKVGFEIFKRDDYVYGYATLSKKTSEGTIESADDYREVERILQTQKQAMDVLKKATSPQITPQQMLELCETAIGIYPRYLDAYLILSTQREIVEDIKRERELYDRVKKIFNNLHADVHFAANVFFNWGEPNTEKTLDNNTRLAEQILLKVLQADPANPIALNVLFRIAAYHRKDISMADHYARQLIAIYPSTIPEVLNVKGWLVCQEDVTYGRSTQSV